jgi:transposase InsO family protein
MSDDESSTYSTPTVSSTKVPLLTPSTYHLWSRELEYHLMQLGLWRIVNGTATRPALLTEESKDMVPLSALTDGSALRDEAQRRKAVEAWEEKDEKAKATIIFAMRKDLRDIVATDMTSKQLWEAIRNKFSKQSLTDAEHTFNTMLSTRYTDGESMTAHINVFRDSNLRLKNTEFHQGDAALVFFLLKSLPSTWEPVKMTIRTNSINGTQPDFDSVSSILKEQAASMKRDSTGGTSTNPIALKVSNQTAAGGKQQTTTRSQQKQKIYHCTYHGQNKSHSTEDCRNLNGQQGKAANKLPTNGKQIANLVNFPDSDEDQEGPRSQQINAYCHTVNGDGQEITVTPGESALSARDMATAANKSTVGDYHVIADTGATSHMWKEDKATLDDYKPVTNQYVELGDGSKRPIVGTGTLRGFTRCGNLNPHIVIHNVYHVPTLAYNLISIGALDDQGYYPRQGDGLCIVTDKHGHIVFAAKKDRRGKSGTYNATFTTHSLSSNTDKTLTAAGTETTGSNDRAQDTCARATAKTSRGSFSASQQHQSCTDPGSTRSPPKEFIKWHERFCHLHPTTILNMFKHEAVTGVDCRAVVRTISSSGPLLPAHCSSCVVAKSKRKPFTGHAERATRPLQKLHMDICGPVRVTGRNRESYFLTITDDYTRYVYVAPTVHKDAATIGPIIQDWVAWAENQHSLKGYRVQTIRSDGGGEFVNSATAAWLKEKGIVQELTTPHTPQLNGISERLNRTLMDKVRAVLSRSGAPEYFWPDALRTVVYVHNRTPHKSLPDHTTPYTRWTDKLPKVGHLRPFGCIAFVHVPKSTSRGKLDARATICMMLGYSTSGKGYRLWDIGHNKIIESRDVDWREWQYYNALPQAVGRGGTPQTSDTTPSSDATSSDNNGSNKQDHHDPPSHSHSSDDSDEEGAEDNPKRHPLTADQSGTDNKTSEPQGNDTSNTESVDGSGVTPSPATIPIPAVRTSRELRGLRDFMIPGPKDSAPSQLGSRLADRERPLSNSALALATAELSFDEPRSYREAMERPDASEWSDACEREIDQLNKTGTWTLVERPPNTNIVGNKWVLKVKVMPNGSIKHKARLVAQGFTQRPGVDYDETYSPVVRYASLRCLFALAAHYDWEVHHMDVKSAYLNGKLEETIYMHQPEGFRKPGQEHLVCKLQKGLYGLKQAGRTWNQTIDPALKQLGLTPLDKDNCVYIHRTGKEMIVISLYVDDLFLFTSSTRLLKQFKQGLTNRFEMEDLGEAKLVLGMQITRDRTKRTLTISQQAYLEKMLDRLGLGESKAIATPMDANKHLVKAPPTHAASESEISHYQSIIGSLMYAANGTRPDIAFAVNQLAKYSGNPDHSHQTALKRILRYIRGTTNQVLTYSGLGGAEPQFVGYSDADYANDQDDRKSTSGYAVMLCGGAISWASRRQPVLATSTTEAEYIAMAEILKDIMWWRPFYRQLGHDTSQPTPLFVDNQATIQLAKNGDNSSRTKHVDIKYHLIRQEIRAQTVVLHYISTQHNIADILTKGLAKERHRTLTNALGLTPA